MRHLQWVEEMEYIYVATEGDSSDENDIIAPVVSFLWTYTQSYLSVKLDEKTACSYVHVHMSRGLLYH